MSYLCSPPAVLEVGAGGPCHAHCDLSGEKPEGPRKSVPAAGCGQFFSCHPEKMLIAVIAVINNILASVFGTARIEKRSLDFETLTPVIGHT